MFASARKRLIIVSPIGAAMTASALVIEIRKLFSCCFLYDSKLSTLFLRCLSLCKFRAAMRRGRVWRVRAGICANFLFQKIKFTASTGQWRPSKGCLQTCDARTVRLMTWPLRSIFCYISLLVSLVYIVLLKHQQQQQQQQQWRICAGVR